MRVLLVSCYDLGHQPLALASAGAFLRNAGHEVRALDCSVEVYDPAAVQWAELVAISVPMHTAMRLAAGIVERVRSQRGEEVRIALFGLYAPLCADSLPVDAAVGGEFEVALVRIADGDQQHGKRIVLDRLEFPLPARDLLPPLHRYARLLRNGAETTTGYVEATRGCVHSCRHCPVPAVYDGRIRVVQLQTLLADVGQLWDAGARHITFGDPDFLNSVPWALAAARGVHQRFPALTFDITTKIEHLLRHAAHLDELRSLGLLFMVSAVETTSAEVLRILDKGHTHADTVRALGLVRDAGLEMRPSLLPFTPWSTLHDYLELLDFVLDAQLLDSVDPVHLTIRLLIPPGSLLLTRDELAPHLRGYDPASFSHAWQHPDPRMDALQRDVAAIAAGAAGCDANERAAHRAIRVVAAEHAAAAGMAWEPRLRAFDSTPVSAPPRLSERWFCCAEPTDMQLAALSAPTLLAG